MQQFAHPRYGGFTMAKTFNITGLCLPEQHYMADTSDKIKQIIKLVENGKYFTINRARQYGKTTTLEMLRRALDKDYTVLSLSFDSMGAASFTNEDCFFRDFLQFQLIPELELQTTDFSSFINELEDYLSDQQISYTLARLSSLLSKLCSLSPNATVMMIDEVDSASNNQVFLDFLAILRNQYLRRSRIKTFQSVILAGVYDIKNLKLKIRPEEEHKYNSPWNIAEPFLVDMSLNPKDILTMLDEYENDWHTGMDKDIMCNLIYDYTNGYPYLVSCYCKLLDERIAQTADFPTKTSAWTKEGFLRANQILLNEKSTLFDDMIKKLTDFPELKETLTDILFRGEKHSNSPYNFAVNTGIMFGFLTPQNEHVVIANRTFETLLYNWLLSESKENLIYQAGENDKNQFIVQGSLQMDLVMKGFLRHYSEIFCDNDEAFLEKNGRKIFLMYLRPIINGTGNYYIEASTRDSKRTDIIVDYHGKQEIIELKIWHGQEYNARGEEQLFHYLEEYKKDKGYLVSFNFNQNKSVGCNEILYNGKKIFEVVV